MFCKMQNSLAINTETKISDSFDLPLSYSILIKKQINHQQSDQIVFQNNLKERSKFLIMFL